ncbi:KEOPS complex subunit Pcc1 [Natronobiforma cellulositropha]|uniref:KEOPS complex subunit Pcc1 n=1 Tax=Natronobiforma cellulositropha TaxID=1679076 RepID=UPI0021D5AC19|nr:KEOPS complex subunit Pcc1 [Natronobiforma cellulositropha]
MSSHTASLEFEADSTESARLLTASVAREVGQIDDERSATTIRREGSTVVCEVTATDVTALRAALNTWFSLVSVAESVHAIGERALE